MGMEKGGGVTEPRGGVSEWKLDAPAGATGGMHPGQRGGTDTLTSSCCFCQCLPRAKPSLKPAEEGTWDRQAVRVSQSVIKAKQGEGKRWT